MNSIQDKIQLEDANAIAAQRWQNFCASRTLGLRHPTVKAFGYNGLCMGNSTAKGDLVVAAAIKHLTTDYPNDTLKTMRGGRKAIFVRVYDDEGNITEAFKLATAYADRAGV